MSAGCDPVSAGTDRRRNRPVVQPAQLESLRASAADDSIPVQRRIIQETARRHDLRIVHSIELADVSGQRLTLTLEEAA